MSTLSPLDEGDPFPGKPDPLQALGAVVLVPPLANEAVPLDKEPGGEPVHPEAKILSDPTGGLTSARVLIDGTSVVEQRREPLLAVERGIGGKRHEVVDRHTPIVVFHQQSRRRAVTEGNMEFGSGTVVLAQVQADVVSHRPGSNPARPTGVLVGQDRSEERR